MEKELINKKNEIENEIEKLKSNWDITLEEFQSFVIYFNSIINAIIYLPEDSIVEYKNILIKLWEIIDSKKDIKKVIQFIEEKYNKKIFKCLNDFSKAFNELEKNPNNI